MEREESRLGIVDGDSEVIASQLPVTREPPSLPTSRLVDTSLGLLRNRKIATQHPAPVSNQQRIWTEMAGEGLSVLARGGFQHGQVHLDHPHHGFHGFGDELITRRYCVAQSASISRSGL